MKLEIRDRLGRAAYEADSSYAQERHEGINRAWDTLLPTVRESYCAEAEAVVLCLFEQLASQFQYILVALTDAEIEVKLSEPLTDLWPRYEEKTVPLTGEGGNP